MIGWMIKIIAVILFLPIIPWLLMIKVIFDFAIEMSGVEDV